jgi:hypothetical protein
MWSPRSFQLRGILNEFLSAFFPLVYQLSLYSPRVGNIFEDIRVHLIYQSYSSNYVFFAARDSAGSRKCGKTVINIYSNLIRNIKIAELRILKKSPLAKLINYKIANVKQLLL